MNDEVEVQPLTVRQREVLLVITRYTAATGESPSLRYVARRLNLHHSRVEQHVHALYLKGWLRTPTTDGLHCLHEQDPTP